MKFFYKSIYGLFFQILMALLASIVVIFLHIVPNTNWNCICKIKEYLARVKRLKVKIYRRLTQYRNFKAYGKMECMHLKKTLKRFEEYYVSIFFNICHG